jgi:hypothetical protein
MAVDAAAAAGDDDDDDVSCKLTGNRLSLSGATDLNLMSVNSTKHVQLPPTARPSRVCPSVSHLHG